MGINNCGYSTLTVTNTAQVMATACSPAKPSQAQGAVITVETDQVRYREDGTDPTSSEGHLLNVGDVLTYNSFEVPGQNWKQILNAIKVIRVTNNAALKISWYD